MLAWVERDNALLGTGPTMRVIHHISISSSPEIRSELARMRIIVDAGGLLITFELDESHGSCPKVQRWIAARRNVDVVRTKFS
jgi:hypothetical protein